MEIDNIEGLENELIILETEDSDTILDQGELIINTLEDIEDKYSIDDENLIYKQQKVVIHDMFIIQNENMSQNLEFLKYEMKKIYICNYSQKRKLWKQR